MIRLLPHDLRFGTVVLACAAGMVASGLPGCERKTNPAADSSGFDPTTAKEEWVEMESLGPDNWLAIEGAQELEWDGKKRTMKIGVGTDLNGARWAGKLPEVPYAMELEARRVSGNDFFCGLTFPVRDGNECVTFIVGGWGGGLVGISSIDGFDASENEYASQHEFESLRWYRIRLEVGKDRIQAWIDDRKVVDADTTGRVLSLRAGPIEACAPFGLATWMTSAEIRGARWRKLDE